MDGQTADSLVQSAARVQTQGELADLLRVLRRRHARGRRDSELTYRELAARTGWSHTAIGEYLTGKTLPPTDRLDALVGVLGATPAERGAFATARDWVEEQRRTAADPGSRDGTDDPGWVAPRLLPAATAAFAGRVEPLQQLDKLLSAKPVAAARIAMVVGAAGTGKTTLAIHWAHQVADHFSDGQLFVNLHGFDPAGSAIAPAVVARRFLAALGVPPQRIPVNPEAQVDLYRRLLAGRRMLILLDNVRDAEQVRPLLPNSAGCFVLLTSRNQLPGLVVGHGADPLRLDPMPTHEAWQLLERRLGAERLASQRAAVAGIITHCAGLPLAFAIEAARAFTHLDFCLDALAGELGEGLDGWASGDPAADVRAAFSWSYRALTPQAARLFRLLGVHPGPEIGTAAAASLVGVTQRQVRPLLVELSGAHLLTEPAPGRYTLHDLLRTYANELTASADSEAERRTAVHRILDHYSRTARSAAAFLDPRRGQVVPPSPVPHVHPEDVADPDQARAWLTTEHPMLLRATVLAERYRFDRHIFVLAWSLAPFLNWRGLWKELVTVQHAGLAAGQRLGDRRLVALAHRGVGVAALLYGQSDQARTHLERALELFKELADPVGQAHTHNNLALLSDQDNRYQDSLANKQSALELFRTAGDLAGVAGTLNSIGWGHAQAGRYREALACCEEALVMLRRLGEHHGEGIVLDSIGFAHHHLGNHQEARRSYEYALKLFRQLGDRTREAETLAHLGDAFRVSGHHPRARTAWQSALAILDEIGHPDVDQIRTKLDAVAETT